MRFKPGSIKFRFLASTRRASIFASTRPFIATSSPNCGTRPGSSIVAVRSKPAVETLKLYRTMRRAARALGMDALGGNVISMTRYPSDMLNVLWLWKWSERTDGGNPRDAELRLPIIPLFETIADLRNAEIEVL